MDEIILKEIYNQVKNGYKVALATITKTIGSTPGKMGATMAVFQNGNTIGSVGGGMIEHKVLNKCVECLKSGEDYNFEYSLNDNGNLGMQCGGTAFGYIKVFKPKPKLIIIGGGHIGLALFKIAKNLDFYTIVIDDREEFANEQRFENVEEVYSGDIPNIIKNISINDELSNEYITTIFYVSIILVFCIYVFNYVKILQHLVNKKTMKLNNQLEENKRLSEEIIDKEKFKNNYFINLSHELRTPINVINSTVQLINSLNESKNVTNEKLNDYMNIISKNCNHLLKIINDIIDSSKIETGKYKINKENNDIVYIVEEAALNMSKFIEEKGINLIIDPDIEEKIISCDETEIERCIINLLANAVKFTEEGGEIRIYIKEIKDNIEITVEDTGIGISKEDQEFIFKRFEQVESTEVTKVSSSGIGLTLVKYVIELHGGYIRLESEINKGSRFTIGLPDIVQGLGDN